MKNFRLNRKGISPIFATLILIAIAVIAGVVVYMFTSGTLATMTGQTSAAQEKITVQGASIDANGNTVVYIQQTAGPTASINSLIIKDSSGSTLGVVAVTTPAISPSPSPTTGTAIATGTLYTVTVTTPTTTPAVTAGTSYTVTVTTAAGGSFVSSSVVAVA